MLDAKEEETTYTNIDFTTGLGTPIRGVNGSGSGRIHVISEHEPIRNSESNSG